MDLEQPVIFHEPGGRRIDVANDLFPNPYALRALAWRNLGDAGFPHRILWHQAVAAR